jgi:hypothetical protein
MPSDDWTWSSQSGDCVVWYITGVSRKCIFSIFNTQPESLFPGILKMRKHNVSETVSASVLRRGKGDTYSVGFLRKSWPKSLDHRIEVSSFEGTQQSLLPKLSVLYSLEYRSVDELQRQWFWVLCTTMRTLWNILGIRFCLLVNWQDKFNPEDGISTTSAVLISDIFISTLLSGRLSSGDLIKCHTAVTSIVAGGMFSIGRSYRVPEKSGTKLILFIDYVSYVYLDTLRIVSAAVPRLCWLFDFAHHTGMVSSTAVCNSLP